ncbi:O-methyltransferase [Tomitella biformata]|uniref:O-methyltransferase n=1 Tax=Tomitella biformata TaxID=630403 RepID=UPI0004633E8D|nr:class I SAM-dependent methyltransferase [Tomitella biformata]
MANTLDSGPVSPLIADLYARAAATPRPAQRPGPDASAQERADAMAEVYMPIDPVAGRMLYSLVRATRPEIVVEFGMSFGISTLHLAAAVRDNGVGRVVTTEMSAAKIAAATATFAEAGLADVIEVLAGDALETLAALPGPVGLVLLDGWKELYLPVLEILEPRLPSGALVIADNASHAGAQPYLERVREPARGYVSVNFPSKADDSMELSCRV